MLYKHQWNTKWAFMQKHDLFTPENNMLFSHVKKSPMLWLHNKSCLTQPKIFYWNGLAFRWCFEWIKRYMATWRYKISLLVLKNISLIRCSVQPPKWPQPRNDPQPWNDPQIDPEMIPNPKMIPKSTPKWYRPQNDRHFSSRWPQNDPHFILGMEW